MTDAIATEPSAKLLAEHDAWVKEQRASYYAKRPAPAGAWDGGNWYRMI